MCWDWQQDPELSVCLLASKARFRLYYTIGVIPLLVSGSVESHQYVNLFILTVYIVNIMYALFLNPDLRMNWLYKVWHYKAVFTEIWLKKVGPASRVCDITSGQIEVIPLCLHGLLKSKVSILQVILWQCCAPPSVQTQFMLVKGLPEQIRFSYSLRHRVEFMMSCGT